MKVLRCWRTKASLLADEMQTFRSERTLEDTPMARLFAAKYGSIPRKWGPIQYLRIVVAFCAIFGTLWVGWRYDKLEAIWRLLEESEQVQSLGHSWPLNWHAHAVNLTIVSNAVASGAVCLDGSPPGYYLDRGTGEGANNWVVFHEGGGWCESPSACLERSFTVLGSSKKLPLKANLGGILSSSPTANPDFYNWNRVLLMYCDGGSFGGDVSEPVKVLSGGKGFNVFYRGQRIWNAVIEELMEIGLKNAEKAFLTGCSAGGLASVLHCDQFRDLMPKETIVKCMSDAGFFIDIPDVSGEKTIEAFYAKVVLLHNMAGNLPKTCTSKREATQCMFPEYLIRELRTPFFMLNSAYDTWSFNNILVPQAADPGGTFDCFKSLLSFCSETQLRIAQDFRDSLLKKLQPIFETEKHGAFINSCYIHCQSQDASLWNDKDGAKVDGKSIARVVGDWYFERNVSKVIDCPFPCNPTCPGNHILFT